MKKYKIEIAVDSQDADEFAAWLNKNGHDAVVGSSTGNYVDGEWTSADQDANQILNDLWNKYCNSSAAAALGSIKQSIITALNAGADPVDFGFDCRADDGQGNEYWCKNQGAIIVRLNCYTDPETDKKYWDEDVTGWENQ